MMKATDIQITCHAACRLRQRGISHEDVQLVLRLGRRLHRTGVTFYFFGRRQIPRGLERALERLVGITLIVAEGHLVTAYRNKRAIAEIKKKPKRRPFPRKAPGRNSGSEIPADPKVTWEPFRWNRCA